MTATAIQPMDLYRTTGGARLHIAPCPHIVGAPTVVATDADRREMEVCHWCRQELDGVGRTYFDSLEDAMGFFGTYVDTKAIIRRTLESVSHDQVWVPNSKSYIALGADGADVAWVGKTYVVPARDTFVALPGYEPGACDQCE